MGGSPEGVGRGLTISYFCAILMLLLREMLGCGFGCAGLFFFCLGLRLISKVICIFMGLPPTPSRHQYYISHGIYLQDGILHKDMPCDISIMHKKNKEAPLGISLAVFLVM